MYFLKYNGNNNILKLDHEPSEEMLKAYTLITVEQYQKFLNIKDLKQNLANTDYKAIKFAEGLINQEEYNDIKAQRQSWRDEINSLEAELSEEIAHNSKNIEDFYLDWFLQTSKYRKLKI